MGTFANIEDPDEIPHNGTFHQYRACTVCFDKIDVQRKNMMFFYGNCNL